MNTSPESYKVKMGLFDKLAFWKKSEDLGLSNMDANLPSPSKFDTNLGMNTPPMESQSPYPPSSFQPQQNYGGGQSQAFPSMQQDQTYAIAKELEVISIKLDALKAALENISQRLYNLERLAYNDNEQQNNTIPRRFYQDMPPRTF
jgi:hypothetical protein